MLPARPSEARLKSVRDLVAIVLAGDEVSLTPQSCAFREDFKKSTSSVKCTFREGDDKKSVSAIGTGPVDALYKALMVEYSARFNSLKGVSFTAFAIEADFVAAKGPNTDAIAEVILETSGNSRRTTTFRNKNRSRNLAVIGVVFDAFNFYINCERAFLKLRSLVKEARARGRSDLASKYTFQMASLVEVACYKSVVDVETESA